MCGFRVLTGLLLGLVVALASVTIVDARRPGAVVWHEICTGSGVMTLVLDREGRPAGPVQHCPDCLLPAVAIAGPGAAAVVARVARRMAGRLRPGVPGRPGAAPPVPLARGPPTRRRTLRRDR